ncbi:MAG: 30S ribosomal protein S6--L-glutamate ligase [Lysobacteraceae bacterium]|nr:30S ribosomal protein S6--L-glutamate ligase [Xanthomonadaceae bacterium]MCZ8319048.1 30S ribosomal protein S6--L-glutamate ligase [Silanimonas sp.]
MPTKIALLSRNPALYSSQRLVEAARQRGCTVRVLDPLRCALKVAPGAFEVRYKGKPLPRFDAVIPRIGHSVTFHGTAVLRHFELMGVATPSTSDAILAARDKLRSHQVLAAEGIDLPVTAFGDSPDDTPALIELVGPAPHVVKLNEGTQGSGVVLAQDEAASRSVIEAFRGLYANFLVQEFVAEAKGADLRCFVVGDEVVAAMQRRAAPGDFRANLHRGGKAVLVRLSEAERDVAIRAARILGLGVAGVDLLRSRRGPLLLEVNSSPGLEGIEAASGVDIAGRILDHVLGQVAARRRRGRASPAVDRD